MGNTASDSRTDNGQVSLSQFHPIKVIGKGAFGKVRMVEYSGNKEIYALKCISKRKCIKMRAVHNILRERAMLELVDHPLVCNMKFAFQDTDCVYMVMDLMMGGDLRFHISRSKHYDEATVRFWIAELVCAVKYLHSRGIVHRDIKPDNILLDSQGHIHLSDFNIASYTPKGGLLTSRSGTAVYFAPEIHQDTGYTEDVDWWSVGITFYEAAYGKRPWPSNISSSDLKQRIMKANIDYACKDDRVVAPECISAIQGFLRIEPTQRFGHKLTGWYNLMQHPFFEGIDWHRMDAGLITPPFRPSSTASNFDAMHGIEELLLGPQGLNELSETHYGGALEWIRGTGHKADEEELSAEKYEKALHQLETCFKSFDYTIYEKYQGFLDPLRMTVGPPPDWVKPAYEGADDGTRLPLKQIHQDALEGQQPPTPDIATHDTAGENDKSMRRSWQPDDVQDKLGDQHMPDQRKKRGSSMAEQYLIEDSYRRNRADSGVFGNSEEVRSKRSSTQSFQERRERDRRRSAGLYAQDARGSNIIASSE